MVLLSSNDYQCRPRCHTFFFSTQNETSLSYKKPFAFTLQSFENQNKNILNTPTLIHRRQRTTQSEGTKRENKMEGWVLTGTTHFELLVGAALIRWIIRAAQCLSLIGEGSNNDKEPLSPSLFHHSPIQRSHTHTRCLTASFARRHNAQSGVKKRLSYKKQNEAPLLGAPG